MNICFRPDFWILVISIIRISSMQENEDYVEEDSSVYENFQITNSEVLHFDDSYCLENISVTIFPSSELGGKHLSLFYVKIVWNSTYFMSSLKVESDSLDDPYCQAQNKHYYCRKPLNQGFHVFPDDVNEGVRFFPFKLDCKYIITPEFEDDCKPLQLNYSTPVCLNLETCSCRNVLIPGPVVESKLKENEIIVSWFFPQTIPNNVDKIVLTIYEEEGINIKKIDRKLIPRQNFTASSRIARSEHFLINVTRNNYRIQGYFETALGCRGNTTLVNLRNSVPLMVQKQNLQQIFFTYSFAIVLLFLLAISIWVFFRRKRLKKIYIKILKKDSLELQSLEHISDKKKFVLPPMEYNSAYLEQSKDSYWFDYRDLNMERQIGSGNFGVVYFATSRKRLGGFNAFAVKQLRDDSGPEGRADFLDEINIFKQVGSHPNVVKMFGYCNAPYPLSIIMEYVPFNLLKYLKNLRVKFESRKQKMDGAAVKYADLYHSSCNDSDDDYISPNEVESVPMNKCASVFDERNSIYYVLDNRELEKFALDIARGMAHLESKAIVHRDLAARNILMDESKNLKISDFGMSRTGIYVNKRAGNFPLRWMSPEALISRTFSNKSDAWSFGVVLWEIATLGAFPYANLQNEEVMSFLNKGGHLDKPENVTEELYKIMEKCWQFRPEDRPTFGDTMLKLEGYCQKSNAYVDFDDLKANYVFPPMEEEIDKNKIKI